MKEKYEPRKVTLDKELHIGDYTINVTFTATTSLGDDGIGSYEFWGAIGFDSQPYEYIEEIDDIEEDGAKRLAAILSELKQTLARVRIAESGYMFIFDGKSQMLIHPTLTGKKISEMISALSRIARADGKITEEETRILESVQINVILYDQALSDALDDGIIDNIEKEMLEALKIRILDEAWDIAKVSEGVSEDELKILDVVLRKLKG